MIHNVVHLPKKIEVAIPIFNLRGVVFTMMASTGTGGVYPVTRAVRHSLRHVGRVLEQVCEDQQRAWQKILKKKLVLSSLFLSLFKKCILFCNTPRIYDKGDGDLAANLESCLA